MTPKRGWQQPSVLIAVGALATLLSTAALWLFDGLAADFAQFVGRFHPLLVHLPIGVLLLVVTAEAASFKAPVRQRLDPVLAPVLGFLLLSSVAAFVVGALLAGGGGYPERLLSLHKGFALATIALVSLCWICFGMHQLRDSERWRTGYRASLVAALLALGLGAHHGGSMTHGESYLVHYAPDFAKRLLGIPPPAALPPPQPKQNQQKAVLYKDVVQPILTKYCVDCHGPDKAKGELRLDSHAALLQGGDSGPAVVPGEPDKSLMVTAIELPVQHDDHMPPEGKPAPSAAERALIRWWVTRGADPSERVEQVLPPAQVLELLKTYAKPQPAPELAEPADATLPKAMDAEAEGEGETVQQEPEAAAPVVEGNSGQIYEDLIRPVLAARCGQCHGPKKQKGDLRVDSLAALRQGGKAGPSLIPGHPERSPLVLRIELPLSHDEHMPPKGKPQLTASELSLLKWWIQDGAQPKRPRTALPAELADEVSVPAPIAESTSDAAVGQEPGPETSPGDSETRALVVPVVERRLSDRELASLPQVVHLYHDVVEPMLHARCGECHIGEFVMGGLNLGTYQALMESGTVVPGVPQESELLARVLLPMGNDERMPPDEAPKVPAYDAALLEFWIARGAEEQGGWSPDQLPGAVAVATFERLSAPTKADPESDGSRQAQPPPAVAHRGCGACSGDASSASLTPYLGGLLVWGARGRRHKPRQENS